MTAPGEGAASGVFLRAECTECAKPDVWLTCQSCETSDRFTVSDEDFVCACGATYDHANCVCGAAVPVARLIAVPVEEGPAHLVEWEVAWDRVVLVCLGALLFAVGVWYAMA